MHIINVTDNNQLRKYNDLVKKVPCIVLFYADWCDHCRNLKPDWINFEKLAREQHKEDDFMIASVNDKFVNKVKGYSSVLGFPTIYHLINGNREAYYEKQRDIDGLIEFLSEVHPGIRIQKGGKRKRKGASKHKTAKKTRKYKKSTKKHRKSKRRTERRRK